MAKKEKTKAPAGASGKKGTASKAQYSADMQQALDQQREAFRKTKAQDNWKPAAGRHTFLVVEVGKMVAKKKPAKNGKPAYTAITKPCKLKQLDGEPHTGKDRVFDYFGCRCGTSNPEFTGAGEFKALAALVEGRAVDDIGECDAAVDKLPGKVLECVVEASEKFTDFNWEGFAQSADVVDEEPTAEPDEDDEDDDNEDEESEADTSSDDGDNEDDEDDDD